MSSTQVFRLADLPVELQTMIASSCPRTDLKALSGANSGMRKAFGPRLFSEIVYPPRHSSPSSSHSVSTEMPAADSYNFPTVLTDNAAWIKRLTLRSAAEPITFSLGAFSNLQEIVFTAEGPFSSAPEDPDDFDSAVDKMTSEWKDRMGGCPARSLKIVYPQRELDWSFVIVEAAKKMPNLTRIEFNYQSRDTDTFDYDIEDELTDIVDDGTQYPKLKEVHITGTKTMSPYILYAILDDATLDDATPEDSDDVSVKQNFEVSIFDPERHTLKFFRDGDEGSVDLKDEESLDRNLPYGFRKLDNGGMLDGGPFQGSVTLCFYDEESQGSSVRRRIVRDANYSDDDRTAYQRSLKETFRKEASQGEVNGEMTEDG